MKVATFQLGPLETNCYVASNNGEAVAVDPGGEPSKVLTYLEKEGLKLTHILVTHCHFDHIYGCKALSEATGAPVLLSAGDEHLLQTQLGGGGTMGLPKVDTFSFEHIEEGEAEFIGLPCTVIATPGHSEGSLSFYFPDGKCLFAGDLLFERSIGRTDFPGGSLDVLTHSVQQKIFELPDETVVYPGHGGSTVIGAEKLHNPFMRLE